MQIASLLEKLIQDIRNQWIEKKQKNYTDIADVAKIRIISDLRR
jgi:hypothetical protein